MRIRIFLLVISLVSLQGFSQKSYLSLNYSIGFPSGDIKDFADGTSGRGAALDYAYFVKENISVGISASWQSFYEDRGYQSFTDGTATLTGKQFNYVNTLPIYLNANYFFKAGTSVKPYVGLGIGTIYASKRSDIGIFEIADDGWAFGVKPEVGLQYMVSSNFALNAAYRYNFASDIDEVGNMSYSSLLIGVAWYY